MIDKPVDDPEKGVLDQQRQRTGGKEERGPGGRFARRYPRRGWYLGVLAICLGWPGVGGWAADDPAPWRALVAAGQLVDIQKYDRTIVVELRYATARNCVGAAVYPADFPCLTRPETALRLHLAQRKLHEWGYRLKIWDAYRPAEAQAILYRRWAGRGFVANPAEGGGSFHTQGLAVDATLVDLLGREVTMPSGFDVFAPEASAIYEGNDPKAARHLHLLQAAMGDSGFEGLRNEWWHFAVKGAAKRPPLVVSPEGRPAPAAR